MASKIKKSAKSAVHNQQALNTPQTSRPKRAIKVTEKARQLLEEKTLVITPKVSKCGKVLPTPDNAGSTQIAKRNPKQGKTSKGPNRCTQEELLTQNISALQVKSSLNNAGGKIKSVAKKQVPKETPQPIPEALPVETNSKRSSSHGAKNLHKESDNVTPVLPPKRGRPKRLDKLTENSNNKIEQNMYPEPEIAVSIKPKSRGRQTKLTKAVAEDKRAVCTPATILAPATTPAGRKANSVFQSSNFEKKTYSSSEPATKSRTQRSLENRSTTAETLNDKSAESEVNFGETRAATASSRTSSRRVKKNEKDCKDNSARSKTAEASSSEPVKVSTAVRQSRTAKETTAASARNVGAVEEPKRNARKKKVIEQTATTEQTTAAEQIVPEEPVKKAATKRGQSKSKEQKTAAVTDDLPSPPKRTRIAAPPTMAKIAAPKSAVKTVTLKSALKNATSKSTEENAPQKSFEPENVTASKSTAASVPTGQDDAGNKTASSPDPLENSKVPIYKLMKFKEESDLEEGDDIYDLPKSSRQQDGNPKKKRKPRAPKQKKHEQKFESTFDLVAQRKSKTFTSNAQKIRAALQATKNSKIKQDVKVSQKATTNIAPSEVEYIPADDNFDDDGYNYYDDPPTYAEETNDTLAEKTSTTEKISTTHKTLKVGATFEKSAASNSIGETSTNIKNTYKPSSLNTQQQRTEKSSALSVPNKGYKTPNRRLATKPMDLGKVSTPRLEQIVSTVSNVTASLNTTSHKVQQPSLIQEKKSCFGFNDDDTYDECEADVSQASSLGGGYVTLSDISPVKRSSMLPPSHCITLIASPSYSNTSGASDFAKPAKPQRFCPHLVLNRNPNKDRSTSHPSFTTVKPKQTFEAPLSKDSISKVGRIPESRITGISEKENRVNSVPVPTVEPPKNKNPFLLPPSANYDANKNSTQVETEIKKSSGNIDKAATKTGKNTGKPRVKNNNKITRSNDGVTATKSGNKAVGESAETKSGKAAVGKKSKKIFGNQAQPLIYEVVGDQKQVKSRKRTTKESERADCVVDPDLLGPFDSRSESELEASETEQQLQHPVSDIHVNTTKRGRANVTYERKSFFENSKASTSHVKAEKHVKGAKKVVDSLANDWESFQTLHFSQIEEVDLSFK